MKIEQSIDAALLNIAKHGDTDVFPFPFETLTFFDNPQECKSLLLELHQNFDQWLASSPPSTIETLAQVGYTGFRWATLIDPFWNAYYLALVITLAEQIEAQRISISHRAVFSYRYKRDRTSGKLFGDSTWNHYRAESLKLSKQYKYVVVTDIADFYPRVYHHRIENSLNRLPSAGDVPKRIMKLLSIFSKNVSYGLPIGGPASRILAELALSSTDLHLNMRNIVFCRYADDYSIFCNDKSDAYRILVFLSKQLYNEGLSLQKKKTRILTAGEFRETAKLLDPADIKDPFAAEEQKLLKISLRFDPYSATAEKDYIALKDAVSQVDIIGILGREVNKSAIDITVARQAISAIRALEGPERGGAIRTLLARENLVVLLPVFVTVMQTIRSLYDELDKSCQDFIDQALVQLYEDKSHLLSVELNQSYYIGALSKRHSSRKEKILLECFDNSTNPLIRRQIILVMANWNCHYWLSDIKNRYAGFQQWEKRSLVLASYALGDEGRHWRDHVKPSWNRMDLLIRDWFSKRYQTNKSMPL